MSDRLSGYHQAPNRQIIAQGICKDIWHRAQMPKIADNGLRDQIARRLKALQRVADVTDGRMADYLGMSRQAYGNATRLPANDKTNKPPEEAMVRLCERTGLTMEWIYRGDLSRVPHELASALKVELELETPLARRARLVVVQLPGLNDGRA